jgi:hypothetical protein
VTGVVTGPDRPRWDDSGASLLLALALMTFIGLVIGALLSYTSSSVRATGAASGRAVRSYASDAALKTAINQVRNSVYNNDAGQTCPDLTVPQADGTSMLVTCKGKAGTGGSSEQVPINPTNTPAQALLTLGTNAGELGISQKSNNELRVQGKVFSSGAIDSGPGILHDVNAQVVARGTCTGTVISSNSAGTVIPNACSAPASAIPADPDYAQPSTGLVYQSLPPCTTGSTVEFSPGYYDDAVGLSAMMNGTGACKGKTFLFQPAAGGGVGIYYFDFHNGEGGGLPTGTRVWTIADTTASIVGGTPSGWVPDVSAPSIPGSCVSPLTTTASSGVRFVFGGDSRIDLRSGSMELCGQYSSSQPPVTLHGAKNGADVVTGPATLTTDGTGTNPTSGPAFANPARITATDANPSTAVIDATNVAGGVTASVVVEGFAPPSAIPAGSILTAAKLTVVHRDNNATAGARLTLLQVSAATTRPGGVALTGVPQPTAYKDGPTGTAYHTDTLDLLSSLGPDVHDHGFTGLRVRYDAGVAFPQKVTENLDSIQLELSWRLPAVRGEKTAVNGGANCVGTYPSGCALLQTSLNNTALYIQGTTYTPYGLLQINLTNSSTQVFRAGLVVRALEVQLTASTGFTGPLIEVPNASDGPVPLEVYFRAYVSAKVVATARVRFPASDPTATPTAGARSVSVVSWAIRRN